MSVRGWNCITEIMPAWAMTVLPTEQQHICICRLTKTRISMQCERRKRHVPNNDCR